MGKYLDLTGLKFNGLFVVKKHHQKTKRGKIMWECLCDCGKIAFRVSDQLKSGKVKSCGCQQTKACVAAATKHGLSRHPLWGVWSGIKQRCYYKKGDSYRNYGAMGVRMCKEWKENFLSFYTWAMQNGWERGLFVDKDIKGNGKLYSPKMCCIVTRAENNDHKRTVRRFLYNGKKVSIKELSLITGIKHDLLYARLVTANLPIKQALMGKKTPVVIEYNGEAKFISEWAEDVGLSTHTIRNRIFESGWSIEKALNRPSRILKKRKP